MLPVEQPFKTYTGLDGKPLDNGYVYFGQPDQNPQTAPVTVFWDAAGTIPAAQPLRTVGGYIMNNGSPANVFFDGPYSELVQDKKRQQVFYARTSDDFSIATLVQTFLSNLALGTGASFIGFVQSGIGAVKRTLLAKLFDLPVQVTDFGVIGAGNDLAIVQKAVDFCKSGRILDFGNLAYDFGTIAAGASAIIIDSPVGMRIIHSGATISCVCASGRASVFGVKNPIDFDAALPTVTQPGYDISSTGSTSNSANGVYAALLWATAPYTADSPCGPVRINGRAHDCAGFVSVDSTGQMGPTGVPLAMRDVRVNGQCQRVFYGSASIYGATDYVVDLVCTDVRRGFISYGQQRAKVDISLKCSPGFLGSNAFVELAAEGAAYGDVQDIDIRARITGCEAHANIVNFYHQGPANTVGAIGNVKARVTLENLTTVGKADGVGPMRVFAFMHEDPSGAILPTTSRATANLDIDCDILGTISGGPVNLATLPQVKNPISLGRGVTEGMADFSMFQVFKVRHGSLTLPFTPAVYGRTSAGTANYSLQKGVMSVSDGIASCSISLAWTAHTGVGPIYVIPLPVSGVSSATIGNPAAAVLASGFGPAGGQIGALLTDQMDTFTVYSVDSTSHVASIPAVPPAGSIYINCTYPIY